MREARFIEPAKSKVNEKKKKTQKQKRTRHEILNGDKSVYMRNVCDNYPLTVHGFRYDVRCVTDSSALEAFLDPMGMNSAHVHGSNLLSEWKKLMQSSLSAETETENKKFVKFNVNHVFLFISSFILPVSVSSSPFRYRVELYGNDNNNDALVDVNPLCCPERKKRCKNQKVHNSPGVLVRARARMCFLEL